MYFNDETVEPYLCRYIAPLVTYTCRSTHLFFTHFSLLRTESVSRICWKCVHILYSIIRSPGLSIGIAFSSVVLHELAITRSVCKNFQKIYPRGYKPWLTLTSVRQSSALHRRNNLDHSLDEISMKTSDVDGTCAIGSLGSSLP